MIGDSHAALFGQRGFLPGSIKATYGTGSSLMTPIQDLRISDRGLSSTVAWGLRDITYALEGNISVTGSAVQWVRPIPRRRGSSAAGRGPRAGGDGDRRSLPRPGVCGLGAPALERSGARHDLRDDAWHHTTHVARAVIESIAYQVRDVFDAMQEEAGMTLSSLLADGGATRNDQLMQFQADILNCVVLAKLLAGGFSAWSSLPGRAGNRVLVKPRGDRGLAPAVRTVRA